MQNSIRLECVCLDHVDPNCAYHNAKKAQALTAKHDHERRLKEAEENKSVLHDLRNNSQVAVSIDLEIALRDTLKILDKNASAETLKNTPLRFISALEEMTSGYALSPEEILSKVFEVQCDDIVILKDIAFTSICEHHLLPIVGHVHIGYIPGKVVGLSKLARLVDCFAKRLQVQERMTNQIAQSIEKYLQATGVAVVSEATHSCLSCRGAKKTGATMICSCMLGTMRTDVACRAEFLQLCKN